MSDPGEAREEFVAHLRNRRSALDHVGVAESEGDVLGEKSRQGDGVLAVDGLKQAPDERRVDGNQRFTSISKRRANAVKDATSPTITGERAAGVWLTSV
jgi:hypothetical protein